MLAFLFRRSPNSQPAPRDEKELAARQAAKEFLEALSGTVLSDIHYGIQYHRHEKGRAMPEYPLDYALALFQWATTKPHLAEQARIILDWMTSGFHLRLNKRVADYARRTNSPYARHIEPGDNISRIPDMAVSMLLLKSLAHAKD